MNVPLLRSNWSATSVIGCRGYDSSLIGQGSVWLAATAHYPSVCTSSDLILPSQIYREGGGCSANHNKLCKWGCQLTMWTWQYCSGPVHLILTQACLMRPCPVLLLFFYSHVWPDKPAMKINDPTLTDSGGNWRAKEVVYHPVTGAIQSCSRPGYRPHAFSFLLCFSFNPPTPTPLRTPSSMRAKLKALITHPDLKLFLWSEPDMKIRKSILDVCCAATFWLQGTQL